MRRESRQRPRYANGRAVRLKLARLQVRILFWAQSSRHTPCAVKRCLFASRHEHHIRAVAAHGVCLLRICGPHAQVRQRLERSGLEPDVWGFESLSRYSRKRGIGNTECGRKIYTSSWSSTECSPACHAGDREFKSRRGRFGKVRGQKAEVRSKQTRAINFS